MLRRQRAGDFRGTETDLVICRMVGGQSHKFHHIVKSTGRSFLPPITLVFFLAAKKVMDLRLSLKCLKTLPIQKCSRDQVQNMIVAEHAPAIRGSVWLCGLQNVISHYLGLQAFQSFERRKLICINLWHVSYGGMQAEMLCVLGFAPNRHDIPIATSPPFVLHSLVW